MFDGINMYTKLQASAVRRFCRAAMTGECTPQKNYVLSYDLDKDQTSNLNVWTIFSMPKVYI